MVRSAGAMNFEFAADTCDANARRAPCAEAPAAQQLPLSDGLQPARPRGFQSSSSNPSVARAAFMREKQVRRAKQARARQAAALAAPGACGIKLTGAGVRGPLSTRDRAMVVRDVCELGASQLEAGAAAGVSQSAVSRLLKRVRAAAESGVGDATDGVALPETPFHNIKRRVGGRKSSEAESLNAAADVLQAFKADPFPLATSPHGRKKRRRRSLPLDGNPCACIILLPAALNNEAREHDHNTTRWPAARKPHRASCGASGGRAAASGQRAQSVQHRERPPDDGQRHRQRRLDGALQRPSQVASTALGVNLAADAQLLAANALTASSTGAPASRAAPAAQTP